MYWEETKNWKITAEAVKKLFSLGCANAWATGGALGRPCEAEAGGTLP